MLNIQRKLIQFNFSNTNDIKYIVVHDTGNSAIGANALKHYFYFNSADRQSSAHYFVDDGNIIQLVEDYNAAWHCGDGRGAYGIDNHNSIGVEICVNSDGNYEKAVANAKELVMYLMNKYNIPITNVVRHYDASRKNCPASMSANNWARWNAFKASLITNGWQLISGDWFYYKDGFMIKNSWQQDSSKRWFYLGADGKMIKNTWAKDSVDWCYCGADGAAVANQWQQDSSKKWFYLGSNFRMVRSATIGDYKVGADGARI